MTAYLITVRAHRDATAPQSLYLVDGDLADAAVAQLTATLLHDPVVESASWQPLTQLAPEADLAGRQWAEIAFRPGVTDNEAESIRGGAVQIGMAGLRVVRTLRRFELARPEAARSHYNPLIQTALVYAGAGVAERAGWYTALLQTPAATTPHVAQVALCAASDEELAQISRKGILALDLAEMRAIQSYYRAEEREPTDGELETLAQTWSEHCSHKTFKARVRYMNGEPRTENQEPSTRELYAALGMLAGDIEIDSLIRTFLMSATNQLIEAQRSAPEAVGSEFSVLSAFVDNAGIIAFTDEYELSFKVETHNHPSALEPFGGANTGVGGVVRDVLGVSALPIANTDVLCFGPLDTPDSAIADGMIPPRQVAAGVVAGVRDYGNKLGIPTVNGAVLYDPGYIANPLVYCGTVGLAPRGRHPRGARPGDLVVALGGRTGRDGIHGATFSSEELTHTTATDVGSAVQIGDPITEKKMIDVVLQARDAGLYRAITDCGAGGLSSAVGEMGEETGAAVELERVPLKYAGLQPWEIWLSEAQERMVLAVPPEKADALLALCASEDVEASVIGRFTGDGRLTVTHHDLTLVSLGMEFLHGGRPQRVLDAIWSPARSPEAPDPAQRAAPALGEVLCALLAHPNIASKATIIHSYDHEVQGRTVVKPLVGALLDGPGDAAVLQPLRSSMRGAAIGCGINPRYGLHDPYWMALACIDEAIRNVVAVGGDPGQAAILDNFCWGDPRHPDRMAGLTRAAAGCYDAAMAYRAPFISGKDSLNNEYRAADGTRTPIPPTLLISALAIVPDVRRAMTSDLKEAGNHVYLVGLTKDELLGSHAALCGLPEGESALPHVDLASAPAIMRAVHAAISGGLVRACHDLSEGGLAVAAAEMAIGGNLGLTIDLGRAARAEGTSDTQLLFSESPTRFLLEVQAADAAAFESALAGLPCARIGEVTNAPDLVVIGAMGDPAVRMPLAELRAAWQGTQVV